MHILREHQPSHPKGDTRMAEGLGQTSSIQTHVAPQAKAAFNKVIKFTSTRITRDNNPPQDEGTSSPPHDPYTNPPHTCLQTRPGSSFPPLSRAPPGVEKPGSPFDRPRPRCPSPAALRRAAAAAISLPPPPAPAPVAEGAGAEP